MPKGDKRITLCDMVMWVKGQDGIALKVSGGVTADEREEIEKAVEQAIQKLGYDTDWIPLI